MGQRRRAISADVRQTVLHEAGYKCGNPACRWILTLDIHHMELVSQGGKDTADNLLPLCPNCHAQHHAGDIPVQSIRAWKMLLLALNQAFDRRSIDLLTMMYKKNTAILLSPDGLIDHCTALLGADLVYYSMREAIRPGCSVPAAYQVMLTDKGKAFVSAWCDGDQAKAIAAMPVLGVPPK